jgi:hypothetical protein
MTVKFSRFRDLGFISSVASELFDRAEKEHTMMAFVFRWMAFNGWMAAITGLERDYEMINILVEDPRICSAYNELMINNADFRSTVNAFSSNWPVLSVSSLRAKLGHDAFSSYNLQDLISKCKLLNVKHEPKNWIHGEVPSWGQVLRAIYQVRCNLFHGQKSQYDSRDQHLVLASDQVLRLLLAYTGCLEWEDSPAYRNAPQP